MDDSIRKKLEIPYTPCPPEAFAGRFREKEKLLEIVSKARQQGQAVLVSGAPGAGKSSFLNWAEYEIQNRSGGLESPAIKKEFLETEGMIYHTYKDLLTELKGHQKFGWLRKAMDSPKIQKSLNLTLGAMEKMSSLAGPMGLGVKVASTVARGLIPAQNVGYCNLLTSFLSMLDNIGNELGENQLLVLIFDDTQLSAGPDFDLLKDLIRNLPSLPPGIAFVISFSLEEQSTEKYQDLQKLLDRLGYEEFRLSGMNTKEIIDFAERRFGVLINEQMAKSLGETLGDPFSLMCCFNRLRVRNLDPNPDNIEKAIPETVNRVRSIYNELDTKWQDRVDCLCILDPPLELFLIACVLDVRKLQDIIRLQNELNQSPIFRRLDKEIYDFAHPSLREYRRQELPQRALTELSARAVKCYQSLREEQIDHDR